MPPTGFSKFFCVFLCVLLFPLLSGCNDKPDNFSDDKVIAKRFLRIGLIPEIDIFSQKKRYQPLVSYLEDKLEITVELTILSRYGNIIDNFVSSELDGAFFGSFTGALALKKLNVVPLARPESTDGTSTYYGMVFVRKDSHIKTAADMKGKRFAFVDKATTAGWLLPLHFFKELNITDYENWFSETYFAGTHEDAINDVLHGRADIGAAKNTIYYRLGKEDSRILDELEILTTSTPVPENGLAVRPGLEKQLVADLETVLLSMDQDPAGKVVLENFGSARFIETSTNDYKVVLDFAEALGLDLAQYQYIND